MDIVVTPDGTVHWNGRAYRCALGRAGVSAAKREGDGATPAGRLPLRRVLFRPDRLAGPVTRLDCEALTPRHGWCDDPGDADYNSQVTLPHPASAEALWRNDALYDLIVVLGHNDAPVVAGAGSAIFLHVAAAGYAPTEGCVALALEDLLELLAAADDGTVLDVRPH